MKLLHTVLDEQADLHSSKIAIHADTDPVTYRELSEKIRRLSLWFSDRLEKQSRVALLLENSPEMVYCLYAIPAAGMVCVPLETGIHERNLSYILRDAQIEMVVTSEKFASKAKGVPGVRTVLFSNIDSEKRREVTTSPLPLDSQQTAFALYTTGTTGPQKGVLLSHHNLLSATKNINQFMQIGPDIVESLPMPLSHSFGFGRLRCVFGVGGTVILENGLLRPERVLERMKQKGANAFSSVPAGFSILLDHFEEAFREIGKQLRWIEIGSAPMRLPHKEKLMALCPKARICMHYGLTEASRATFLEFRSEKAHLSTVGKPSPNVALKIADEKGDDLGPDKTGSIWVKGEMVMQGYWNKPELTQETLSSGWLRTGDLGAVDGKGYLHLMGREKELINLGGLKVAPGEVEEVLLRFDGVLEAAVVGIKSSDEITDETIRAFLVVEDQKKFVSFEPLKRYCLKELEAYKVPSRFELVTSLPKTASGKIQRHLLVHGKE